MFKILHRNEIEFSEKEFHRTIKQSLYQGERFLFYS